jgi:uncharacterized membrane protein YfcA
MKNIFRIIIATILACIVCLACVLLATYIYDAIFAKSETTNLTITQIIFMFCTYCFASFLGAYTINRWSANIYNTKPGLIFTVIIAFVFAYLLNNINTSYMHIILYFTGILVAGYYGAKMSTKINFKNLKN